MTTRSRLSVAVLDGKHYAVGGNLSSVERYDPATNAWEAVAPLTLARFGAGVAALEGKQAVACTLWAVGSRRTTRLLRLTGRLTWWSGSTRPQTFGRRWRRW